MEPSLSRLFDRWRVRRDPRDLAEVFDRISPELLRIAIHLVGEPSTAEDLVQTTFLTAIERAPAFDETRRLEPWLAGILENHARDVLRDSKRLPEPDRLEQRLQESPLDSALARELSAEVAAALDHLPEPYRRTMILRVRHGLAPADIAHVLGESPGAVRVRLHRALELVRKRLPEGLALSASFSIEPARGLSAVKIAVLSAAGGGLFMKKLTALAVVLLALLAGWWTWTILSPADSGDAHTAPVVADLEVPPTSSPRTAPEMQSIPATRMTGGSESPSRGERHVLGRVVDGERGLPVAGAQVEFHSARPMLLSEVRRRWSDRLERDSQLDSPARAGWPLVYGPLHPAQLADREPVLVAAAPEEGAVPLGVATSDADGYFDVPCHDPRGFVVCRAQGYAVRETALRTRVDRSYARDGVLHEDSFEPTSIVVRVFPDYEIHGRLIDEHGAPIHARVALRFDGDAGDAERKQAPVDDPQVGVGSWRVITDDSGSFRVRVAAPVVEVKSADPLWTSCDEAEHPTVRRRVTMPRLVSREAAENELLVVLRRTPVLRVRDATTGAPIETLTVAARTPDGGTVFAGRYAAPRGEVRLVPEDVGSRSRFLGEGRKIAYTVWSAGYAARVVEAVLDARGPDVEVDLERGDGNLIAGRVVRDGRPVPGAWIHATAESPSGWTLGSSGAFDAFGVLDGATSDAEGRFELRLGAGFHVVHCRVDGIERTRGVLVPPSEPCLIDLALDAVLLARVRGPDGLPLANAVVTVRSRAVGVTTVLRTDEHGEAVVEGLEPGPYRVDVSFASAAHYGIREAQSELELAPGRTRLVEFDASPRQPRYARLEVAGESDLTAWQARGPESSRFISVEHTGRIPIELDARARVLVVSRGDGPTWSFRVAVNSPDEIVLHVDPQGRGYDVELISSHDGQPIAGVGVVGFGRDTTLGASYRATSDTAGIARLRDLSTEGTSLGIEMSGLQAGAIVVMPKTQPATPARRLRVELPTLSGGELQGCSVTHVHGVVRSNGVPIEGARVRASALVDQTDATVLLRVSPSDVRAAADGTFALDVPATGTIRFLVAWPDGHTDTMDWSYDAHAKDVAHDIDRP